jgi:hypothetical protein
MGVFLGNLDGASWEYHRLDGFERIRHGRHQVWGTRDICFTQRTDVTEVAAQGFFTLITSTVQISRIDERVGYLQDGGLT